MALRPSVATALLATTGLLVLAAIDIASTRGGFEGHDATLLAAGAAPVLAFAALALAPSRAT